MTLKKYKKKYSLNKDKICRMISAKTNIKLDHVYSVINLLLDEMQKELIKTGVIKITNFGKIELFKPKPKKIVNISTGEPQVVSGKKRLRFVLSKTFSSFISKFISTE